MEWKNIYRGMMMGASDVVPGVSGGTIALVLGIYDQLILSINGLFSKEWKKHLGFLIPLGLGMVTAILLLAQAIEWLFEHYPRPTQFAFLGLILGVLPYLFKKADSKHQFKTLHYLLLVLGVGLAAMMGFLKGDESFIIENITPSVYGYLLLAGFIASTAMILPGISGSLILVIMGAYGTIINAVNEMKLDILFVVAIGIGFGLITMSKVIKFFLTHYTYATYAVVIGLVIGSIYVIFPGLPTTLGDWSLSVIAFGFGLSLAYMLGQMEYQEVIKE
ncbi:DUF368 domain-containing protein [Halolactibacillus alkaliphilus]|uniref:DUF368 domain-containing protein n=1 Tax=Halolactibacillus alkaliphilus TaxID=442899 RepID=A0A511X118_9BACI|nr:DUF368 domain-containing protein [Halolactibacillus alkaliphilus]GEN56621.1 DUF368 domain-containing protein [Halolactibacillus alkaliphilus]GGN69817.1 DUF368 domain-containing protein [Halolactibacillus alkaliphilus]SFO76041.1 putative membrane protein [Halolactibacillus alkaliphilus]